MLAAVGADVLRGRVVGESHGAAAGVAVVVGVLLAVGSVASAPPMPPTPTRAYETPLDLCRPPFRPQ